MVRVSRWLLAVFLLIGSLAIVVPASAASIGNDAFQRIWARTDQPVSQLHVSRTWMWGPEANTGLLNEPYSDSPGGKRTVQYFDKSRMEINDPNGDQNSLWYVTNGLLTQELITGRMSTGNVAFEQHDPAQVNVTGDPGDTNAPTYATFNGLLGSAPLPTGSVITQTLNRAGNVGGNGDLGGYNVTAATFVPEKNHVVASVFWDFMNSSGLVYENGGEHNAPLFQNPFYATGFPTTEAYWTQVKVGGVTKRVLVQAFERRVLTYTPDNPDGWKVEAGNVGQHYYQWRYGQLGKTPIPAPSPSPSPSPSSSPAPGHDNVDYDCKHFKTHAEAQRYFESQGGSPSNNVDGLDHNHDGIACESLP